MKQWLVGAAGGVSAHVRALVQAGAVVMAVAGSDAAGAEADPSANPDKSQYTLFNPTPRQLMRELNTDRPDKTESPFTLDPGISNRDRHLELLTTATIPLSPTPRRNREHRAAEPQGGVVQQRGFSACDRNLTSVRACTTLQAVRCRTGFGDITYDQVEHLGQRRWCHRFGAHALREAADEPG